MLKITHYGHYSLCAADLLLKFTQGHTLHCVLSPTWTDQTHWEAGEIEVTKEKF